MQDLAKVLFATIVFVIISLLARPFPAAAGMMLTFPVINGLSFLFKPASSAEEMARTMLWMPIINGALCGIYIVVFLFGGGIRAPVPFACTELVVIILIWATIITRESVKVGVPPEKQPVVGLVYLLFGIGLTGVTIWVQQRSGIALNTGSLVNISSSFDWFFQPLNQIKIFIFAATFAAFLGLSNYFPDVRIHGILGGLPAVPFGGLVSVAGFGPDNLAERLLVLERMATTVWLGPIIGFCFIYIYSRFLSSRKEDATFFNAAVNFLVLLIAWVACFLIICGIALAISYIVQPGMTPG
jgi:hypothetical protein